MNKLVRQVLIETLTYLDKIDKIKGGRNAEKSKNLQYYLELPYTVIIIPEEIGGFSVEIKELNGCMTSGDMWGEIRTNIEDAKRLWLETAIEKKQRIPEPLENMLGWEKYKRGGEKNENPPN